MARSRHLSARIRALNLLLAALCLALSACGGNDNDEGSTAAVFEAAACEMPLPEGQDPANVECGYVTVPENRSRSGGPTVRLAVAVLKAMGPAPADDPIVNLGAGLGPVLDASMQLFTADFAAPLQVARDLVFIDQRGSGRSRPLLDCPEAVGGTEQYAENQSIEADTARDAQRLLACHDRLVAGGIDLSAYTTSALAADARDVLHALGYQRWNVYGLSQTTRIAQTLMRDFAAELRSVVLDSPIPISHVHLPDSAANFERTIGLIAADCAADSGCAQAYPDLARRIFDLIPTLNASPLTVEPLDPSGVPFRVVLTGDHAVQINALALQLAEAIPLFPFIGRQLELRGTGFLTAALGQLAQVSTSGLGLVYSVVCDDQVPAMTPEVLARAAEGVRPEVSHVFQAGDNSLYLAVCRGWSASNAHVETQPVVSDIPTLILSGQYDPAAPPVYGQMIAETLSHSYRFELRGYGHGELYAFAAPTGPPGCAMQVMAAFLDDPEHEPDASCVDAIPPPQFLAVP